MVCQFERLIYPTSAQNVDLSSFMIATYRPCEKIYDLDGNLVSSVKAVGYCLPISGAIRYNMQGKWNKNTKHGVQFEVETYDEVILPTKEGIIAYLSSGQISGVGPKTAEKIYATLSKYYNCEFDDRGNIGKRYRRQDEIGTPFCITYDFESEEDGAVTVRDRDTMEQVRVNTADLKDYLRNYFNE